MKRFTTQIIETHKEIDELKAGIHREEDLHELYVKLGLYLMLNNDIGEYMDKVLYHQIAHDDKISIKEKWRLFTHWYEDTTGETFNEEDL